MTLVQLYKGIRIERDEDRVQPDGYNVHNPYFDWRVPSEQSLAGGYDLQCMQEGLQRNRRCWQPDGCTRWL